MEENIRFKAKFKKVDLFNDTLHIIIYPEEGLKTANALYDLKEGQKIKVIILAEND